MDIGKKLRKIRLANGLTQEELAGRADLTKGYISQLENDATSPSISTLKDLLDVLGVSISEFFSDPVEPQVVFGPESRVRAARNDGIQVDLLVPGAQNRSMDPALVSLRPGETTQDQSSHQGEELGFVLQGRIELLLEGKTYPVRKGECFYFHSGQKHSLRNPGAAEARILWVATPPTFDC